MSEAPSGAERKPSYSVQSAPAVSSAGTSTSNDGWRVTSMSPLTVEITSSTWEASTP